MEFKKQAVKSWSTIVPEEQGKGGEKRYHLSTASNSTLIALGLNVTKPIKIAFVKESLKKYTGLLFSCNFYRYLNDNYLYQPSGTTTYKVSEKFDEFTSKSYDYLMNIDQLIDAEVVIDRDNQDSTRVYIGSTDFMKQLSNVCPALISGIKITKAELENVYNLEVYFDQNILEQYSIKCNQLEEEQRAQIPEWKEMFRFNTMPTFVFEVFKYLDEKNDISIIQNHLVPNDDPKYCTLNYSDKRISRLFWRFEFLPSIEDLSQGKKQRAFELKSFEIDGKGYYLSKEWENKTGATLDINIFVDIFNSLYSRYQIIKDGDFYIFRINIQESLTFNFYQSAKKAGLIYSLQLIQRFVASLYTKPFVILSGLSGSGKTKLAQAFVQWISEDKERYRIIPVGADWTNREPLLGYPNGLDSKSYITPDSGALKLIMEASKVANKNQPYFMILDEMNLSHIERYFADFLSVMESGDSIKLYSGDLRLDSEGIEIEKEFFWPKNLFVIGTVNIDETTYMFSPKVLDRANVIEFRIADTEMKYYFDKRKPLVMEELFLNNDKTCGGAGQKFAENFYSISQDKTVSNILETQGDENILNKFFSELQIVGAEFGYRSASEIELLITKLSLNGFDDNGVPHTNSSYIDIAIMQKLLPKLHGSRKKLVGPLETFAGFCLIRLNDSKPDERNKNKNLYQQFLSENRDEQKWEVKYSISFEKIERMLKNVIENGFTSYAEA
jgi:energy-coupling factor transporter ATP-binding protein EcfA2